MQSHVEHDNQTINMKERQNAQQNIVTIEIVESVHLAHVRHDIVVRQHHALGQTRRAARIRQRDQIVLGIDFNRGHLAVTCQQRCERRRAFTLTKDEQFFDVGRRSSRFGLIDT